MKTGAMVRQIRYLCRGPVNDTVQLGSIEDLHQERICGERIVVYQHPRNIAQHFQRQTDDHPNGKAPSLVPDSES